jgi:hypothetical protein
MKSVLSNLLPQIGEVENWFPEGETEYASDEDLYLIINGGAEIYFEYGFKDAVFQSYKSKDDQFINLEIYEMMDPGGAFGIYTFKTGDDGIPIEFGQGGWLESYFLNFWEGNLVVTVTGLSIDEEVLNGIRKIASAVDSNLEFESELPSLVNFLPEENLKLNGITYLRGNLALFNQDIFDPKDIFGLKEGVIGNYHDYSILLFQYQDTGESKEWYEFAKTHLKESSRFKNFFDQDSQFETENHHNQRLSIKSHQRWIISIFGKRNLDADQIFESVETRLRMEKK